MKELPARTRQHALMEVLFHALRVTDTVLNRNAALVLTQMSIAPVRRLVLGAAHRKNRVPHRLRMLAVIERIGQLSDVDDWMDLSILAADPNEQIRIAAGETLAEIGLTQGEIRLRGAALQCRITTEDPAAGFRPDTGKITTYRSPGGGGIRLDGGTIDPRHPDQPALRLNAREDDLPRA